jgi:AsmA family protein
MLAVLKWIGIVLGVLVLGVVLWYFLIFDWNDMRRHVSAAVGERAAREFSIDGDLTVNLGLTTRVRMEQVRLENAEWSAHPNMFEAALLDFTIRIPDLLRGRVVIPALVLERPRLVLQRNPEGEVNWDFVTDPAAEVAIETAVPEEREEFPIIGRLAIDDGVLVYQDATRDIDIESQVNTAFGEHEPGVEMVHLRGQGDFEHHPFTLTATGGSLLMLREEDDPYPVHIEAQVGETYIRVEGHVLDPLAAVGLDLRMTLEGQDLAEIYPIFGIPFPPTNPYHLAGQLNRDGSVWQFLGFRGVVGRSDLGGDLSVDAGQSPPFMQARFVSQQLELAELGGFLGVRPQEVVEPEVRERLIPDSPVNLERLHAMNVDVTFAGERVIAGELPFESVEYRLVLDGGQMRFDPLTFRVADGTVSGPVLLDGSRDVPVLAIDLAFEELRLGRFFPEMEVIEVAEGLFGGRVELRGEGGSLGEILGVSEGGLWLAMSGGAIDRFVVAAVGLDVAQMITLLGTEEPPMPLRCSVGGFTVADGVMEAKTLLIDAETTIITGEGTINLGGEEFDLRLEAHPKEPSPLVLGGEVTVAGRFLEPDIGIDLAEAAGRVGAAVALGAVLAPLAALLPFLEPGLEEDARCEELFEQAAAAVEEERPDVEAREHAPEPPPDEPEDNDDDEPDAAEGGTGDTEEETPQPPHVGPPGK